MIFLATIIGWGCLLVLTLVITFTTIALLYFSSAVNEEKPGFEFILFAIVAALLWYATYTSFPFEVAMKAISQ